MKSLKCPKCNLTNFADAELCKRCGLNLKESSSFTNSNLFTCPDCQNLCSKTAPSCPSCGKIFTAAPVYITQPPKKTSPFTWFVLVVILAIPILCCLSSSNKNTTSDYSTATTTTNSSKDPKDYNNPSGRKTFANGFQQMAIDSGKSTIFDTEGIDGTTLSIKSSILERSDCLGFVTSDWAKSAASVGFNKVTCRNNVSNEQWSYTLTP